LFEASDTDDEIERLKAAQVISERGYGQSSQPVP
jgi:hypothetical protein